jgi:aminopeptidase N
LKKILFFILLFNSTISYGQINEGIEFGKFHNTNKSSKKLTANPLLENYDVVYYGLNIEASNTTGFISSGIATIKAKVLSTPLNQFVIQLIDVLTVSEVKLNGVSVVFTHLNNEISFTCPTSIGVGELFSVEVHYSGTPQGGGWNNTIASGWNMPVTWTLSESFHAYEWFPVKQSLTDKADSSDVYVTVPSNLKVASNGVLKQVVNVGGNRKRFEWQSRYPIDYYLISVTISDYVEYNTYANFTGLDKPLLIQNFVYNSAGCLDQNKTIIDGTADIIELYSNLFGIYPFKNEKYGHVMAPFGGGMEHQTITMLGYFSNGLIAHELAHMWFGDYVTCGTWQDIWINEGFASYCEYLNLQNLGSQSSADSWMYTAQNSARQKPNGSVYLNVTESSDENRIFSSQLSYKKGAAIIHMLRNEINNDNTFFNILKLYLQRHGNNTATGADFKSVVNEVTGQDYTWFFDEWYYGYGYPTYTMVYGFSDNNSWVTITQTPSNSLTPLFKTSMELKLTYNDLTSSTRRIFISENPQTFIFDTPKIKTLQVDPKGWLLYSIGSVTSVELIEGDNSLVSIGPNPFDNKIQFYVPNYSNPIQLLFLDMTGRKVLEQTFEVTQFEVNTTNLPKGIYIVKAICGSKFSTTKLVKD